MLAGLVVVAVIVLVLSLFKAVRKLLMIAAVGACVLFAFSWMNANVTSSGTLKSQLSFPNPIQQVQGSLADAAQPVQMIKDMLNTASNGLAQLNQILPSLIGNGSGTGGSAPTTTPGSSIPDLSSNLNSVSSVLGSAGSK